MRNEAAADSRETFGECPTRKPSRRKQGQGELFADAVRRRVAYQPFDAFDAFDAFEGSGLAGAARRLAGPFFFSGTDFFAVLRDAGRLVVDIR